ncbi:MAG: hypothetical protein A2Y62_15125 [Candidatus Fischerbacteria bacterium RBG_13_37_8]|uniref:Zinc-finger domain-containing protein n=1 Tax=Candidatus Fischerbacteria bacterium RBG_13_37_8 TaxID=1817863 RepID=A0A1F5VNF4_9BACT|nr:MAG: hypothetical protein A2Y62_15125 [Candidatus Fischerbacteria bacterium RBG_13_37_8]
MNKLTHYNTKEIEQYIAEELYEEKELEIGKHLAECKECMELVQAQFRIIFSLEQWTATTHGRADWYVRMRKILQNALENTEVSIQQRIKNWMTEWNCRVGGIIQIIFKNAERAAEVITDFPDLLLAPGASRQFVHAIAIGANKHQGEITIISKDDPSIEITIDQKKRSAMIRIKGPRSFNPLLILATETGKPIVVETQKIEGTNFYGAYFENIPEGTYTLILEPENAVRQ